MEEGEGLSRHDGDNLNGDLAAGRKGRGWRRTAVEAWDRRGSPPAARQSGLVPGRVGPGRPRNLSNPRDNPTEGSAGTGFLRTEAGSTGGAGGHL